MFGGKYKMVKGHCMKCKEKREMKEAEVTKTAKGGYMAKGTCVKCSTKMCAMMSKDNAEQAIKDGVKKSF